MKRKRVPMLMFAFHIWSTTPVNSCASMYSLIKCTWYKVSHNKSNTSYMPMHSCKVKSCPPTKIISSYNLLFNRLQSSDFRNLLLPCKKKTIHTNKAIKLHLAGSFSNQPHDLLSPCYRKCSTTYKKFR